MGAQVRFLPAHCREAIADEIEMHLNRVTVLIGRLDRADGDVDLEEDDHHGDPIDERGEAPTEDGTELLSISPLYMVDQSRGPINGAAERHHRLRRLAARAR